MSPFGSLSLAGTPTITQSPGVVQPAGTVLPILTAVTLQDTFTNLPEGALAKGDNQAFRVSYANIKVTLTAAPTGPFVVDNTGDIDDGDYAAGQVTLREARRYNPSITSEGVFSSPAPISTGTAAPISPSAPMPGRNRASSSTSRSAANSSKRPASMPSNADSGEVSASPPGISTAMAWPI